MNNKVVTTMLGAVALTGAAYAGPAPVVAEEKSSCGSWCDTLETIGTVYSNKENSYIQKVKFFGRAQVQYGYIDGEDVDGNDFNEDFEEVRRLRFGGEVKFLNGFKLKANANLIKDGANLAGARGIEYTFFDQAKLSYTKKDIFGFDAGSIIYGRHKVAVGAEQHTSSKKIKTVERSAISNKLTTARPTGVTFDADRGSWNGTFGVFSTDNPNDFVGNWDANFAFYLSNEFKLTSGDLLIDFVYNDQNSSGEELLKGTSKSYQAFAYEWALSGAYSTQLGAWDTSFNVAVGDNGDKSDNRDGLFYGFVALGTTDIIENKLEFVTRYAYQGAEEDEGIRTSGRYFRRSANGGEVNSGRGDSHHALYAGLNWYMCGDRSKVMTGMEYDNISTPDGTADAVTLWLAYRTYF